MRSLRNISKVLMIPPIYTLGYDLIHGWFVKNRFKIGTMEEWWRAVNESSLSAMKPFLKAVLSTNGLKAWLSWPAPLSLLVFPVVLYTIYYVWFRINGGHGSNAFTYKSHD